MLFFPIYDTIIKIKKNHIHVNGHLLPGADHSRERFCRIHNFLFIFILFYFDFI